VRPFLEDGDGIELIESSDAAHPGIDHPLLARLAELAAGPVQPKLGWTDVARFSARGVPAVNFGPGDATLAHRADERVEADSLLAVYSALAALVTAAG
jgi:succinyl-diaminopimelate desuccinylase